MKTKIDQSRLNSTTWKRVFDSRSVQEPCRLKWIRERVPFRELLSWNQWRNKGLTSKVNVTRSPSSTKRSTISGSDSNESELSVDTCEHVVFWSPIVVFCLQTCGATRMRKQIPQRQHHDVIVILKLRRRQFCVNDQRRFDLRVTCRLIACDSSSRWGLHLRFADSAYHNYHERERRWHTLYYR